jgi:molybdopterin-containing oxidoreductase family membrane subunit
MIVTYAMVINVFFLVVEIFTAFYSQIPEEMSHFRYLLFGLEGQASLVPWMWTSIVLALVAIVLLVNPGTRQRTNTLVLACVAVFVSIWIDKGLGLVVTGFIPSTSGMVFEYWPTVPEAVITLGVWALGFLILTILYKIAISVREEMLT